MPDAPKARPWWPIHRQDSREPTARCPSLTARLPNLCPRSPNLTARLGESTPGLPEILFKAGGIHCNVPKSTSARVRTYSTLAGPYRNLVETDCELDKTCGKLGGSACLPVGIDRRPSGNEDLDGERAEWGILRALRRCGISGPIVLHIQVAFAQSLRRLRAFVIVEKCQKRLILTRSKMCSTICVPER
jgi:hypothetical protein